MKANELRIGNYVNIEGDVVKVKEIYEKSIHYANGEYESYATEDFIQPIELTEELMLKIGFKKERQLISNLFYLDYETDVDNIIRVKYVIYPKAPSLLKITTSQCWNYECFEFIKRGIRYLHQLQNAYYCLTNEELKVEL